MIRTGLAQELHVDLHQHLRKAHVMKLLFNSTVIACSLLTATCASADPIKPTSRTFTTAGYQYTIEVFSGTGLTWLDDPIGGTQGVQGLIADQDNQYTLAVIRNNPQWLAIQPHLKSFITDFYTSNTPVYFWFDGIYNSLLPDPPNLADAPAPWVDLNSVPTPNANFGVYILGQYNCIGQSSSGQTPCGNSLEQWTFNWNTDNGTTLAFALLEYPVPLPATAALFGIGLLGLASALRRRAS
jgi:hypothetical protein